MAHNRQFNVFGEPVEVLVSTESSKGALAVITQTCNPGGGPPPHIHTQEDEFFLPVYGEFEIFNGETWKPLTAEGIFAPRHAVHAFRNCGATEGKIIAICTPGNLDIFLEEISVVDMPRDLDKLISISAAYGITYPTFATPAPDAKTEPVCVQR